MRATIFSFVALLGFVFVPMSAHAQVQRTAGEQAVAPDPVLAICQKHFAPGFTYEGDMQIRWNGDGPMVSVPVSVTYRSCAAVPANDGVRRIKLTLDYTNNGKTDPNRTWYFVVYGQTLSWRNQESRGEIRATVIVLSDDGRSYVEGRTYTRYSNETEMRRK